LTRVDLAFQLGLDLGAAAHRLIDEEVRLIEQLSIPQHGRPVPQEAQPTVHQRQLQAQDLGRQPTAQRRDRLVLSRPVLHLAPAEDALPAAVVDKVLLNSQASEAGHVVDEVLPPVAAVDDLQHQIEAPPLLHHRPAHPRVHLTRVDHAQHHEQIGAEHLFPRVEHRKLTVQVGESVAPKEEVIQQPPGPRLCPPVGAALAHRLLVGHQGGPRLGDEALPRRRAHLRPNLGGRRDGQGWQRGGRQAQGGGAHGGP